LLALRDRLAQDPEASGSSATASTAGPTYSRCAPVSGGTCSVKPRMTPTGSFSESQCDTSFTNFLVGLLFVPVAAVIGEGPTFWIFAAFSAAAFAYAYVPETRGRSI
jgi:hypothetical protein